MHLQRVVVEVLLRFKDILDGLDNKRVKKKNPVFYAGFFVPFIGYR